MARWPAPLRCKSRLARGIGPRRAASVQQRLQAHTLAELQQSCRLLRCDGWLAIAGAGVRGASRLPLADWLTQVDQGRGSLGLRMQRQFVRAFRCGYRQVVLIGSDLPRLGGSDLQQAFAALSQTPAVLGPATDGGYWLIGLSRPAPDLFAGIAWGSDQVLSQTCARAAVLALPLTLLRQQSDLDRESDLAPWR